MPGWQELQNEIGADLAVIGVAIDEDPDDVREFAEGIDFPVLIDRDHTLTETYAITNVPTLVWIDEENRIARPNSVAFGTDMFKDFHGIDSRPFKDAVRTWVETGEVDLPDAEATAAVADLSDDEVRARLHFRIGAHLRRTGREAAAATQFARAGELAPNDFTIRRAAMPLVGDDPFGEKFFALYGEWEAAGSPYNGVAPARPD